MGIRRALAVVGALVALALPTLPAWAADTQHKIIVLHGSGIAAVFRSARCVINNYGFVAYAHDRGYELLVRVHPFDGFHHYPLRRGGATGIFIVLVSPAHVTYASDYVPPYPVPGGGAINFTHRGELMGAGFHPMFSADGSDAVTVAGVLACHYPKHKH